MPARAMSTFTDHFKVLGLLWKIKSLKAVMLGYSASACLGWSSNMHFFFFNSITLKQYHSNILVVNCFGLFLMMSHLACSLWRLTGVGISKYELVELSRKPQVSLVWARC